MMMPQIIRALMWVMRQRSKKASRSSRQFTTLWNRPRAPTFRSHCQLDHKSIDYNL